MKKFWKVIVATVATIVTYGATSGWAASWAAGAFGAGTTAAAVAGGALAGGIAGFVGGAIGSGSLKGALRGAFSGAVFGGLGGYFKAANVGDFAQVASHAIAGGIMSDLQGGNFGHGFFTAGVMKGFGKIDFGGLKVIGRTVIQAMVGGTVSRITGGKFANGAVTSAIQFVVNEKSGWIRDRWEDLKGIGRDLRAFVKASELDTAGAAGYGLKFSSPTGSSVNAQAKIAAGIKFTDNESEQGFFLKGTLAFEAEVPFAKVGFGSIEGEGFFLPEKGHVYWKDPVIRSPKWELIGINLPSTNVFEASLTIQPVNVNYKFDWNKFERLRNGG